MDIFFYFIDPNCSDKTCVSEGQHVVDPQQQGVGILVHISVKKA